jgi:hypothetical protein
VGNELGSLSIACFRRCVSNVGCTYISSIPEAIQVLASFAFVRWNSRKGCIKANARGGPSHMGINK